jgi:hypothetical protein
MNDKLTPEGVQFLTELRALIERHDVSINGDYGECFTIYRGRDSEPVFVGSSLDIGNWEQPAT